MVNDLLVFISTQELCHLILPPRCHVEEEEWESSWVGIWQLAKGILPQKEQWSNIESDFSTFPAYVVVWAKLGNRDVTSVDYLNYNWCCLVLDKVLFFCCSTEGKGESIVEFL